MRDLGCATVSPRSRTRAISNREVIDELRRMQQHMRALEARMSKIEHKQQKLALRFTQGTMDFDSSHLVRVEVHRVR